MWLLAWFFLLGLIIGSFLNAWIFRLRAGESVATGRSKCPYCQRSLVFYDLVPVISFILLKRKCRYCQKPISWQYPVVELVTGILFAVIFYHYSLPATSGNLFLLARDLIAVSALIGIFVYDLRFMEIPDEISLLAIFLLILFGLLAGVSWTSMLIGGLVGFGFFAVQYFVSKGAWLGGGDLRLGALMGILLGWPIVILAIFLAYIGGAIVSVGLMIAKKATPKTAVPLGVFLVPATIIFMIFGQAFALWYFKGLL